MRERERKKHKAWTRINERRPGNLITGGKGKGRRPCDRKGRKKPASYESRTK
jgi:hypothetical protein